MEAEKLTFIEGKDYQFIRENDKTHYDYIIQIRFEPNNDEDPFYTWEIGVINPVITKAKTNVNKVVFDYLSKVPYKPYDNYRIALMDYSKKEKNEI